MHHMDKALFEFKSVLTLLYKDMKIIMSNILQNATQIITELQIDKLYLRYLNTCLNVKASNLICLS